MNWTLVWIALCPGLMVAGTLAAWSVVAVVGDWLSPPLTAEDDVRECEGGN